jgi:hypothetical protein
MCSLGWKRWSLVLGLALLTPASVNAADLACPPAEAGTIVVDGLLDDWHDVAALQSGDPGSGVSLRCDTEGKTLYLSIEVNDDRVVRTPQARTGEDHVSLRVGNQRYTIFPAAGANKVKIVPSGPRVASSSGDRGFVIELAFPFSRFPGLGRGLERLPVALRFDDCDSAATLKTSRTVSVEGELAFTDGPSTLDGFLEERGLHKSQVRWKRPIRFGKTPSQLVLAGKLVAVVGEGYAFVELPVADGNDVRSPRLVDLAGDGRKAVLLEYIERGEGGERTVLAAYRPSGDKIERVFAAEIGKRTTAGKLQSKVDLRRRGKATDVVLTAQPAQGLSAETYKEQPASDVVPILLPWEAGKKATFTFNGDGYQRR